MTEVFSKALLEEENGACKEGACKDGVTEELKSFATDLLSSVSYKNDSWVYDLEDAPISDTIYFGAIFSVISESRVTNWL